MELYLRPAGGATDGSLVGVVVLLFPGAVGAADVSRLEHPEAGVFAVDCMDGAAAFCWEQALQGAALQHGLPPLPAVVAPVIEAVFGQGDHIGHPDLPAELPPL